MKFSRLRLSGFKSFVEPTDLEIAPGLTGVVGPNGCGKSNLLEALRWVMGESSYKSMRASGMDDVIFSGTSKRPARNMAEVMVTLDNSDYSAPPQFNADEVIEVSRRIERESGSAYRINGRDMRARDVQLLFADASTGARSPALVRQGQISELISAKPQNRRKILEEAAGISGLHTRRHEAELKLRAAEANLTRLDDVVAQMESQLNSLKRQARQAIKYKQISADIRYMEAGSLYLSWKQASENLDQVKASLDEVARLAAGFTRAVSEKTRARDEAGEALPKLRENEAIRAAVLQRLTIEREGLEREEQQANARRGELKGRLQQIAQDLVREKDLLADVDGALSRLDAEAVELSKAQGNDKETRAKAAIKMQATADKLANMQQKADETNARLSEITAKRRAIEARISEQERLGIKLAGELKTVNERREALIEKSGSKDELGQLSQVVEAALAAVQASEAEVGDAEKSLQKARDAELVSRRAYDEVRAHSDKLTTEVRTLTKLLNVNDDDLWPPLIDSIKVKPGYEMALGAALGEDIDVPADEASPVHWRLLGDMSDAPALPDGVEALANYVDAPAVLARRLQHIGVVDEATGAQLQKGLRSGQRLVSKAGDLWRWDGFSSAADAPTAAAKRLAERNRLGALQEQSNEAQIKANAARKQHEETRKQVETLQQLQNQKRNEWRRASQSLEAARRNLGARERALSEQLQQISALEEAGRRVADSQNESAKAFEAAKVELGELPSGDGIEKELMLLRDEVNSMRASYADARAEHDGLERDARMHAERLQRIEQEKQSWVKRVARAKEQIDILTAREAKTQTELESQSDVPKAFEEKRRKLMSALRDAQADKEKVSDQLAVAENGLREAEKLLRLAETELAKAREEQARLEARNDSARERKAECAHRISESLQCAPGDVIEKAGLEVDKLPEIAVLEQKLATLKNQRERLGGVNLRAEIEAGEVSKNLNELVTEREDVISAINKLRHGIGSLNQEGRKRLLEAFDEVNSHFGELFVSLFGGGKAELQLIESDDPLEAGLEILANPPGKRPQVLSLLSGGEQALTAMALIFAVFLTNPSPICVLDEVDAPLDDHNVERFCNLLDRMLEKSDTRFLIITHHALTMARMNRLYGVTMMERGVSQLVSVDLEAAERMVEAV